MNTFQITRGAKVTAYVPGTGFIDGTVVGKGNANGFYLVMNSKGDCYEVYARSIAPAQGSK